ncbi:MAG: nickel-dependent hydrogenase large subunit [Rhodobacteraceae bacterium]|nr:nickel-dependent hydrogenase large subunit [Paracoccaceae bacterium]
MSRLVVGPFNRVEGDLEVRLEVDGDHVQSARVVSPLYRGFEGMLRGKDPRDALVISPRICGICSVSQSISAAEALAAAQGIKPLPNGQLVTNLVHATENVSDHLTHFYMFFMPDFTRDIYAGKPWHSAVASRFAAMKGTATQDMLPPRAEFMHIVGLLAGKWPHTMSLQPGGVTRVVAPHEVQHLRALLSSFRRYLERFVFGGPLEAFAEIDSLAALANWASRKAGDLSTFLQISRDLGLETLGHAGDRFLSFGGYAHENGHLFTRGLSLGDVPQKLNTGLISEDISNAWMQGAGPARHPFDGETLPDGDMESGYTWCKAPRLEGLPAEVGALARQVVARHPLALEMVANGGNVEARIVARFLEIALLVPQMERWLSKIRPDDAFITHADMPDHAEGAGLVEAARGALGHWLKVENGKIANYQIIAPTTWNFSPRDASGQPGPLEQALVAAPVQKGETDPVSVQHIVRSFDPCMVCTVH